MCGLPSVRHPCSPKAPVAHSLVLLVYLGLFFEPTCYFSPYLPPNMGLCKRANFPRGSVHKPVSAGGRAVICPGARGPGDLEAARRASVPSSGRAPGRELTQCAEDASSKSHASEETAGRRGFGRVALLLRRTLFCGWF